MTSPLPFQVSFSRVKFEEFGGIDPWMVEKHVSTWAFSGSHFYEMAKENISGFQEIEDNLIPTAWVFDH